MLKNKTVFSEENKKVYLYEMLACFIMDTFVILLFSALILSCYDGKISDLVLIIIVIVLYFISATILNYRKGILEIIDLIKKDTIVQTVTLVNYKIESSWSGRLWHSIIAKFYPKEYGVDTYRLYFINENGKKKYVRLIMSVKKRSKIFNICEDKQNKVEICYLKRSKILLSLGNFELDKII